VDYFQFVQKSDTSQNFYDPEGYFVFRDIVIPRFIIVNDHTEIAIGVKLGDDALLETYKFEILDVNDHVTALVFQLLQHSNFVYDFIVKVIDHFNYSPIL
jgi:hypothetical protein